MRRNLLKCKGCIPCEFLCSYFLVLFLLSTCGSEQSSALRHSYICGIGVGQTYFPKNDVFIDEFMEPLLQTLLPVIFVNHLEVSIVFQYIGDMHRIHCWKNSPPLGNKPLLHGNTLHCILTPKFKKFDKNRQRKCDCFLQMYFGNIYSMQ